MRTKKVYYEDKEYTYYEATQIQRHLERDIRNLKKRVMMYDTVGDKEMHAIESFKLKKKRDEYYKFSDSVGINKRLENLHKFGYNKSVSSRSVWANKNVVNDKILNDIVNKQWSNEFKTKAMRVYEEFKQNGYTMDSHFIGRFLQRKNQKGFKEVDTKDILNLLENKPNFKQIDNRLVYFGKDLQMVCIKNGDNLEFISFVRRKNERKDWVKL